MSNLEPNLEPDKTVTTPNAVRLPNAEELRQVEAWLKENSWGEVFPDWFHSAWIAVFDNYATDGPCYGGKVLIVIWGGYPDACTIFTEENGKLVLSSSHDDVCGRRDDR